MRPGRTGRLGWTKGCFLTGKRCEWHVSKNGQEEDRFRTDSGLHLVSSRTRWPCAFEVSGLGMQSPSQVLVGATGGDESSRGTGLRGKDAADKHHRVPNQTNTPGGK